MEPEKLEVIARGMGYEVTLGTAGQWKGAVLIWNKDKRAPYNPITNAEQCMEIMEKLIDAGHSICKLGNFYHVEFWQFDDCSLSVSGKTINEAVCNAAFEHFKGE